MCIGGRRECVWRVRNSSMPRNRVVVSVGEASHTHKPDLSPPSNQAFVTTNVHCAFGDAVSNLSKLVFHIFFAKLCYVPMTQNPV